jgi:hypothetical protein
MVARGEAQRNPWKPSRSNRIKPRERRKKLRFAAPRLQSVPDNGTLHSTNNPTSLSVNGRPLRNSKPKNIGLGFASRKT